MLTSGTIDWGASWLRVILASVLLMSALHGELSRWRRAFERDRNIKSQRLYRVITVHAARLLVPTGFIDPDVVVLAKCLNK